MTLDETRRGAARRWITARAMQMAVWYLAIAAAAVCLMNYSPPRQVRDSAGRVFLIRYDPGFTILPHIAFIILLLALIAYRVVLGKRAAVGTAHIALACGVWLLTSLLL